MKATLGFNLPDENEEFEAAQNGLEWKSVVTETLDFLRYQLKHTDRSPDEYGAFEEIRNAIIEKLDDRNLSVW